jgi:myosin heavy subunit
VKASLAAAEEKRKRESRAFEEAKLQVEAAQYEADRAFDQFDQCDPKNRLVADTLEERLNGKLEDLKATKEKLEALSARNPELTAQQTRRLEELSKNFPSVWNHPAVDPKLKKRLLRAAIHEILVKREAEQQRLEVTIHWKGGAHSRIHVPKRSENHSKKAASSLVGIVRKLAAELSDADITRILNMQKTSTPNGLRWTQDRVEAFRHHHRIPLGKPKKDPDILNMSEVIASLGISHNGLLKLVKLGAISPNQITEFAPWRVSRAELGSDRVQRLVKVLKTTGRLPKGGSPENQLTIFDDKN